jgi:hypothetical protein
VTGHHRVAENVVNEVTYLERMRKAAVPEHLHEGLVGYLVHGIKPGSFLAAVLENNLMIAVTSADEQSMAGLRAIVRFLLHSAPDGAWGSRATVNAWIAERAAVQS